MKKIFLAIGFLLCSSLPAFATFGAATQWDVRTTGVDTNGGGFDSGVGSPGTDISQGSGTAITVTLTGTTTGTGSPAFTSTTNGPGNFVHIASGTGCTIGWYEILSQSSGTATFDHAMGSSTDNCVGTIGGSLLTVQTADGQTVIGNTVNIQAGTYTWTSTYTVHITTGIITWKGYQTTHGDGGTKPLITTATNSTRLINTALSTNGAFLLQNVSLSNTAATNADGIWQQSVHCTSGTTGATWVFNQDKFSGFAITANSADSAGDEVCAVIFNGTEVTGSTVAAVEGGGTFQWLGIFGSYFHANVLDVLTTTIGSGAEFSNSIFAGSTGASEVEFNEGQFAQLHTIRNCTFYGAAGDAVHFNVGGFFYSSLQNNIFYGNNRAVEVVAGSVQITNGPVASFNNAYGSNTNANINWTEVNGPITLTANPFVNATSGNFALNSTAGGGALLKAAGFPAAWGTTTTNFMDVGAAQSQGSTTTTTGNYGVSH